MARKESRELRQAAVLLLCCCATLLAGCASSRPTDPFASTATSQPSPATASAPPVAPSNIVPANALPASAAPCPAPRPVSEFVVRAGYAEPAPDANAPPAPLPPVAPLPSPGSPTAHPPAPDPTAYSLQPTASAAMPIDLPTALQLVDANNPTIAVARSRFREAFLAQRQAELAWLPDLRAGPTYDRHDGRDQNSNGTIFEVSKQNLFVNGQVELDWDTSELLFGRLAAQRLTQAADANARAVSSNVQLEVALAYLDLLSAYGDYAIYVDAFARAEEMLRNAESAEKAGLSKTTADINRARTEVDLRREREFQIQAQIAVASARLTRLLLLRPTVLLKPNDPAIVPVTLIGAPDRLEELVTIGLNNRPELQQNRALVAAANTRWRQAQVGFLIPHLGLTYDGGEFGGGVGDQMSDFGASSDGTAEAYWQLHNMGAGEVVQSRIRQTQANEASLNLVDVQSRVAEDVTAAAQNAAANRQAMGVAEQAVVQALETWRRLREASFGLAGAEHQYDPLGPLIALRDLADARRRYLASVIDYNRSQFQLYWALGQPPLSALPKMEPQPVTIPVVPGPYAPAEEVPPPKNAAP